jgi:hypothetical protein
MAINFLDGITINGTTSLTTTGNVGIGTTSPTRRLVVREGTGNAEIAFGNHPSASTEPCIMASDSSGNLDRIFQRQVSTNAVFIGDIDNNSGDVFVRAGGVTELSIKNGGQTQLNTYTSTSVATTGSLDPNQNFQAATQDTLANLTVDPNGKVVRGDQEGTWTFTNAQLQATLGNTLISAPGAGKGIVVLESNWMVKYSGSGSMSANQFYDIRQANNVNNSSIISRLPGNKINEIMLASQGTITNPSYGFYSRDVPTDAGGKTYKANVATTLHKTTSGNPPANLISISIKLKYRIFNGTTF